MRLGVPGVLDRCSPPGTRAKPLILEGSTAGDILRLGFDRCRMARGGVLAKLRAGTKRTPSSKHVRGINYVLLDSPFHLVAQTKNAWANSMKCDSSAAGNLFDAKACCRHAMSTGSRWTLTFPGCFGGGNECVHFIVALEHR